MIRSNVVTGVMSFDEMDAMMYKIEGEDLYLIGTSEHSMIGKFIDTMNEAVRIQKDGHDKRMAAEQELIKIENEIKQALLS